MEHLGRSSKAKNPINAEKVKCDGRTDGRTDGPTDRRTDEPTKRGVESRSTRLKMNHFFLGAPTHLHNWLCPLVMLTFDKPPDLMALLAFLDASVRNASLLVGWSVCPSITHVQKPRFLAVFGHGEILY